jgi:hypothetical protein
MAACREARQMPRKPKEKIDIDVVPYLSIMVIVLKLICLILIVTVMRIALNPQGKLIIIIKDLQQLKEEASKDKKKLPKVPTYIECRQDGLFIFPGDKTIGIDDLVTPDNAFSQLLSDVEGNATNQYVIMIVRPNSLPFYRYVRKALSRRQIDMGYDVLESDIKLDWKASAKSQGIDMRKFDKKK